jgi:hypothetical protein
MSLSRQTAHQVLGQVELVCETDGVALPHPQLKMAIQHQNLDEYAIWRSIRDDSTYLLESDNDLPWSEQRIHAPSKLQHSATVRPFLLEPEV